MKTEYIKGMCFIISLKPFRATDSVDFHIVPDVIKGLSSIDRVKHDPDAVSPTVAGHEGHTHWYMHPNQEDNLLVYGGTRMVELYTVEHGKVERFEVTPEYIKHNDEVIHNGPSILGWNTNVFHRVISPDGSISSNFAKHSKGFDIKTNFSIYELNVETGEYSVARTGDKDQF